MALPITPTPKLNRKESGRFLKEVEERLKTPAELTPTPKLVQAKKTIRKYANQQKRR